MKTFILMAALSGSIAAASAYGQGVAVDPAVQQAQRHNVEMERIAWQQAKEQRQADEAQLAQLAQVLEQQQAELAQQQADMERKPFLEAQAAGPEALAAWYKVHGSAYASQLSTSQKTRQPLVIGMTATDVRTAWGAPENVDYMVWVNGTWTYWCYDSCRAAVILQDGRVQSFQQSR